MRIEELKLIPPSKRSSAVLVEFIKMRKNIGKNINIASLILTKADENCYNNRV